MAVVLFEVMPLRAAIWVVGLPLLFVLVMVFPVFFDRAKDD